MKKLFVFVLCAVCLFAMSGCAPIEEIISHAKDDIVISRDEENTGGENGFDFEDEQITTQHIIINGAVGGDISSIDVGDIMYEKSPFAYVAVNDTSAHVTPDYEGEVTGTYSKAEAVSVYYRTENESGIWAKTDLGWVNMEDLVCECCYVSEGPDVIPDEDLSIAQEWRYVEIDHNEDYTEDYMKFYGVFYFYEDGFWYFESVGSYYYFEYGQEIYGGELSETRPNMWGRYELDGDKITIICDYIEGEDGNNYPLSDTYTYELTWGRLVLRGDDHSVTALYSDSLSGIYERLHSGDQ